MKTSRAVLVSSAGFLLAAMSGCAGSGAQATSPESAEIAEATFTFQPELGKPFKHRMTRYQELSIVGTESHQSEEWIIDWEVVIEKETNQYRIVGRLVGLQIRANGQELFDGKEVAAKTAGLQIILDKDANISDIRGTETLTQALIELAPAASKEAISRAFSPEQLKGLFFERVQERTRDLLGRPTKIGETWMSNEGTHGVVTTKQLKVAGRAACGGGAACLRVERIYDLDQAAVWGMAQAQVETWVKERGGDPKTIQLGQVEVEMKDELIVEPTTLTFHHANFDQKAKILVSNGAQQMEIQLLVKRESLYSR